MQGSLRTGLISYLSFVVLIIVFIGRCGCLRLLSDLLGGVVVLRLLSDWLGGAGVSAVGTTLLKSPGCNEGKARNATLGKHRQKRIELRRSGTHSEHLVCGFAFVRKVPPLWGSINVFQCITQGLRPGLCRSIAPLGLLARPHQSPPLNTTNNTITIKQIHKHDRT